MEFGIQVGNVDWPQLRDLAQTAEALGFGFLGLPDHLVHEGPERQHDPKALSYDPVLQAAVAAEATRTLRVGHLVLCNLFRQPAFTAQAIVSLDHLSGGRAFLGLGSGWTETEFRMTGIPFPEIGARLRMLDEAFTIIRSLWSQEATTFDGEFYHYRDAILWPKPLQQPRPPILVGGSGKGLLRIAARHADVVNIISDVGRAGYIRFAGVRAFGDAEFLARATFVREEAARLGRDPQSIRLSSIVFQTILTDSPAATRSTAEGMAGGMGIAPDAVLRHPLFLLGTPDECAAELRRRARTWGLAEVVFGVNQPALLRRLGEEVLPRV